jgi:5-methyltetrahydropteroyltriglutamate--homocysteine methyltransferase
MSTAHVLGFPRIGAKRELKFALEAFWRGELDEAGLQQTGRELRARHWKLQSQAGLDFVTVGDFAWYDQVLNTLAHLGGLPRRFGFDSPALTLDQYFEAARGNAGQPAMELTKWFDTNYHYLVPEWTPDMRFGPGVSWLFDEVNEARALGYPAKVVLTGPLTLLYLGKLKGGATNKLDLLPGLLRAYVALLSRLRERGVAWVQIDEPILALELEQPWVDAFAPVYEALALASPAILLASYFDSVAHHSAMLKSLPVSGLHLDMVRAPDQLAVFLDAYPQDKILSLGVVNGRNVWRADLERVLQDLAPAYRQLGARLWIGSSCSLLHVPVDANGEDGLESGLRKRLSYAVQKLEEIAALKRGLLRGKESIPAAASASHEEHDARQAASPAAAAMTPAQRRLAELTEGDYRRSSSYTVRSARQRAKLNLPLFPTTTIGSFPQTSTIRKARAAYKQGAMSESAYAEAMREEILHTVARQEELGLDVLVHGEAERNDMVEYFGEQLEGMATTAHAWVQSYGSRCVKPPLIHGDVTRPRPMTVEWSRYAQSLTAKPMKGMLTGPITLLQWSFVREDQPRETTALQIALALREEVRDLEKAGIGVIQIDEPALREGLPLRKRDWHGYLDWAVRAFKLASSGVADETQIHTHMCYAEFNDILDAIAALDADVITIETSRSDMELLEAFGNFAYPNEIGPGVYDIHSPRVPTADDMLRLLDKAARVVPVERLWVNPDCGLKTRGWAETERGLLNMVEAARRMRGQVEGDERASAAGRHA